MGLFHFVYGASPQQILLHLHIILLHLPIKFASFTQKFHRDGQYEVIYSMKGVSLVDSVYFQMCPQIA